MRPIMLLERSATSVTMCMHFTCFSIIWPHHYWAPVLQPLLIDMLRLRSHSRPYLIPWRIAVQSWTEWKISSVRIWRRMCRQFIGAKRSNNGMESSNVSRSFIWSKPCTLRETALQFNRSSIILRPTAEHIASHMRMYRYWIPCIIDFLCLDLHVKSQWKPDRQKGLYWHQS